MVYNGSTVAAGIALLCLVFLSTSLAVSVWNASVPFVIDPNVSVQKNNQTQIVVHNITSDAQPITMSTPPPAGTERAVANSTNNLDKEEDYDNDSPLKLTLQGYDEVSIQIASDLHVEFYGTPDRLPTGIITRQAPVLALLGDVGLAFTDVLRVFLHRQADVFEHVLFLAGNHEFYNQRNAQQHTVQEQMEWMKRVCDEKPNLHFLEQRAVEINHEVLILATTLWSHVPSRLADAANRSMNDYHLSFIADGKGGMVKMTPAFTNQWHDSSVEWLERQLDMATKRGRRAIVLTHHTPSLQGTSHPRYDGSDMSHCFSTDLTRLLLHHAVHVWACGHTHYNFDQWFPKNETRLLSNQRGYPGQENMDYDDEGIVIKAPETTHRGRKT